jgi:hypothetical protein
MAFLQKDTMLKNGFYSTDKDNTGLSIRQIFALVMPGNRAN